MTSFVQLVVTLALAAPEVPPSRPAIARQASPPLGVPAPEPAPPKKEVRVITLDETQARAFHTVVTHPLAPAVVEFPEPFVGTPVCGDCIDGSSPPQVLASSPALFLVDLVPAEHFLTIKPIQQPRSEGGSIPDEHYLTTLTVRLQSKVTLTLRVQYGSVGLADGRVVFTLPGRAGQSRYVEEQVARRTAELEAAFAARVADSADEAFLRVLLEPHGCAMPGRRERNDNLFLELKEVCRFGGRGYLRFSLENRSSALFQVGLVEVVTGRDREAAALNGTRALFAEGATEVPFQRTVHGIVSFELLEGAADSVQLAVSEAGGRPRRVQLTEVRLP
jgi:hypothetical protein